nr:MHC class II beta chain like protein [Triakis scyllium]BBO94055.1 major histocompatibility complex, class II alpha chain, WA_DS10_01 precursor [Triakis scyllium]BBO94056.1 major histocompatibility complex, class II alpha chain, WA_DS10_02 precursor [Triakis scyllium]
MSRESFLLLLLLSPGTGLSATDTWRVLVACYITDDPNPLEMMCEVTADSRIFIYYDTSIHLLEGGLEEYRGVLVELARDRNRAIASLRQTMALAAIATNFSSPPNEMADLLLFPEKEVTYGEANILSCLVSGAFPPTITITLQVNGAPLHTDANSSRLWYGEDWRFQAVRRAHIRPEAGDMYSCQVQHTVSKEVKMVYWEPEMPDSWEESILDSSQLGVLVGGVAVGALGMALGIGSCVWPKALSRNQSLLRIRSSLRSSSSV